MLVSGIEVISATATVSAATVSLGTFNGVTTVQSVGSTADVSFTNAEVIPTINLTGTSTDLTVVAAAPVVAGLADSVTINLSSVASNASNTVTFNGIESITVNATGTSGATLADGTVRNTTIVSDTLTSLTVAGTGTAKLDVTMSGAGVGTTGTTATVTGSAGNDDIFIRTPAAASKLSVSLGAGDDIVRLANVNAAQAISGGDGTDTLVYSGGNATAAATANITGFERVVMAAGSNFTLATSDLTYAVAAGGTYTGLAAGGTVNLTAGGSLTLANAALTGTTDAVTVNVGTATTAAATGATIAAGTFDVVTVNALARSDVLPTASAAVSVSGTTLNTVILNSAQGVTLSGGGAALTTIDASGVAGDFSSTATTSATASLSITGGAGDDTITGGGRNDTLIGGAGDDTITGGAGADTMTGGDGADTFVIAANTATSGAGAISIATAADVITDFTSGTDKLDVGAAAFLGNFTNIQQALAANAAAGVAARSAAFVTGENALYVFTAPGAALNVLDTVVTLTGVTSITAADLLLGAQGAGATITATAGAAPAISPTAAVVTQRTTNFDDTIVASTPATGTSSLTNGSINGGLGNDTLNATIATNGGLTGLTAAAATTVALTSVENVNITSTAGGVVNLGANIGTDIRSLTVSSSAVTGVGLTATTTEDNQSITVNSAVLAANNGAVSTITVGDHANNSVTTGSGNDVITITGGANTTDLSVNAGAGDDVVILNAATALSNARNVLNGGANASATSAGDTLRFDYAVGATLDLAALVTAGTISGFEVVDLFADQAAAVTVTLATGITGIAMGDATGAETLTVNATAAQATALRSFTTHADDTGILVISDAGSVNLTGAAKTLTGLDQVNWGTQAVSLTLHNGAVAVTQAGGTADQSVTFGSLVAAQTATIGSTGTVTFSIAGTAYQTNVGTGNINLTVTAAAAANAVLNFTGAAATIDLLDANLVDTNIDIFSVGAMSGSATITAGTTGANVVAGIIDLAETGATQIAHTVRVDSVGTQSAAVTIRGFDAGATGDVLDLSDTGAGNNVTATSVVTTGATVGIVADADDAVQLIIGNTAAAQISGALTQTGDAGAVEAAIIALGLTATASTATNFYVALDNGTDTGIYRVAANAGADGVINTANELSVTLVSTLEGIGDVAALTPQNFV